MVSQHSGFKLLGDIDLNGHNIIGSWELLETLTYSANATKTSGTLKVCGEYKVVVDVSGSAAADIKIRYNGDSGNNYYVFLFINVTPTYAAAANNAGIMSVEPTVPGYAVIQTQGKCQAVASGSLVGTVEAAGFTAAGKFRGISIRWLGGNATQISNMTVYASAGNLTGTVKIYGK